MHNIPLTHLPSLRLPACENTSSKGTWFNVCYANYEFCALEPDFDIIHAETMNRSL